MLFLFAYGRGSLVEFETGVPSRYGFEASATEGLLCRCNDARLKCSNFQSLPVGAERKFEEWCIAHKYLPRQKKGFIGFVANGIRKHQKEGIEWNPNPSTSKRMTPKLESYSPVFYTMVPGKDSMRGLCHQCEQI
ncbi:hypothetical protein TNCT_283611 [Trichonephila clavata]|uniref:Uncharacterized protein n=1 Tax=Trichonephila clavata TaxID=2740835 RepID=A0A8X6G298_TRICU|nr:hypothetical protein TNCT_283611 [Trichonephila clavata]